ncbi:hypothetical protein [Vibrio mexicanus]|uniref:hypothetical protein n=1 Tax=Vibrio mexicanus TaxID=1004326 RepID=UPI00063C24E3|nr:hypothetical protein [Vibrio mexicanus]
MIKTILVLAGVGLAPSAAMAYDCSSVPVYDEANTFQVGDTVQVDGNAILVKSRGGAPSVGLMRRRQAGHLKMRGTKRAYVRQ